MTPIANTALSGLAAASKRLEISATNIANINSTKRLENGQIVDKPFRQLNAQQVSDANGGVQIKVSESDLPPERVPALSNNPDAKDGIAELPNVDLAAQLVNQKIATYDFQANLKTIKVADNLQKSLLDIFS